MPVWLLLLFVASIAATMYSAWRVVRLVDTIETQGLWSVMG
jgi:hypothetical protein